MKLMDVKTSPSKQFMSAVIQRGCEIFPTCFFPFKTVAMGVAIPADVVLTGLEKKCVLCDWERDKTFKT